MIASPAEELLGEREFRAIARALHRATGIALPETKRPLVYSRLARRLRVLGLDGFRSYADLIEGPEGGAELGFMISALTTNVTSFFREPHHFALVRDQALPALADRARDGGRVRLWSSASSTGEEPLSLAMTVLEACPEAGRLDIRILATDIDPVVLDHARAGRYRRADIAVFASARRARWFEPDGDEHVRAVAALRDLVSYRQLNLVGDWPMKGPFDAIFCRNVAIYFDRQGQERLWTGFARLLPPGGHLCIGHSERLSGPAVALFRPVGITAFTRLA